VTHIPAVAQEHSARLLAAYEEQRARRDADAQEAAEKPATEAAPVLMRDLGSLWT
jgi:hypothetical protein